MLVLDVPEAVLDVEEKAISARTAGTWTTVQAWGKLRRLRGDAQGLADLRQATAVFRRVFTDVSPQMLNSWMTPGYTLLMAGERDEGRTLIAQARRIAEAEVRDSGPNTVDSGDLIEACFLLGDYAAAVEAYSAVAVRSSKAMAKLRSGQVAIAARAILKNDPRSATEAAETCAGWARRQRCQYTEGGPLSLWEATEFILTAVAEMTGEVPAGLRPFGPR